ncbi:hypothetical protein H5410_059863 [Solanum commersonii]|uniref:Uncharacterized protein n=1 Tax=Solanum commersonii TaxID=4109 RepID=A0A9J5W3X5_SOLCO|nr:hypothetical protein H5410_059863 [Solanum commersonii]
MKLTKFYVQVCANKQMFWLHDTDIHFEVSVQVDLKESYMQLFDRDDDIKALTFIRDANL